MAGYPKPKKFIPINPEKYAGDVNNIICRSSWEAKYCRWCDNNPSVIAWNSEDVKIPYWSVADQKNRNYYVDFIVRIKNMDGIEEVFLVEIKPYKQTIPPKNNKRKSKETYANECYTYQVNCDKWEKAREWAKNKGIKFVIYDEYDLEIKQLVRGKKR